MDRNHLLLSYLALASFASGVFCGAVYDVFRILRAFAFKSKLIIFFEDLVYCAFVSLCLSVLYYNYSNGRVRAYAIVCLALGFSLYYFTLGKLTQGICRKIKRLFVKIFLYLRKKSKEFSLKLYRKKHTAAKIRKTIAFASRGFGL